MNLLAVPGHLPTGRLVRKERSWQELAFPAPALCFIDPPGRRVGTEADGAGAKAWQCHICREGATGLSSSQW